MQGEKLGGYRDIQTEDGLGAPGLGTRMGVVEVLRS